jgi:hypothetical protein
VTEDDFLELGARGLELLLSSNFNDFTTRFETQTADAMLATKAEDSREREKLYSELLGLRAFISFVRDAVEVAQKIKEKNDNRHAPTIEDLDDPSVHDIYAWADDQEDKATTA